MTDEALDILQKKIEDEQREGVRILERKATFFSRAVERGNSVTEMEFTIDDFEAIVAETAPDAIEEKAFNVLVVPCAQWDRKADLARAALVLRRAGMKVQAADKWERVVRDEQPRLAKLLAQQNGHSNGSELQAGHNYRVVDGQILHLVDGNAQVVADFEARITSEITDEAGNRTYRLSGKTRKRDFSLEISASKFEDERSLRAAVGAAAGSDAAIRARMSPHLAPSIKLLSENVERIQRYERTGWSPHGFLVPGRELKGIEIISQRRLPYSIPKSAELRHARVALECLIKSLGAERTVPIIVFALTGPAARCLPLLVKRSGLAVYGRTGSLKTSFTQLVMCIYGSGFLYDENLLKMGEGTTRNAAMKLAASAADLPFFMDNFKPTTGAGDRDFVNLIHNIIEGGEKARLNRNSELQEHGDIRAWPIFTGEDLPNTDAASLARVLAVEFEWQHGASNEHLTTAQRLAEHLPSIGKYWIEWLEGEGHAVATEIGTSFHSRRDEWSRVLQHERPDMVNTLRVASNLAANSVVYEIASRFVIFGDILRKYADEYESGLRRIALRMGEVTATSLEAERFLRGLKSLRAAGRITFLDRHEPNKQDGIQHVGWKDSAGYYVLVDIAREAVEDLYRRTGGLSSITNAALYTQIDGLGLIASKDPGRTTKTFRPKGYEATVVRVLHLKRGALEDEELQDVTAQSATVAETGRDGAGRGAFRSSTFLSA